MRRRAALRTVSHCDITHCVTLPANSQVECQLAAPVVRQWQCSGFRVRGSPDFDQLCTVVGTGFGTITPEYWSALHNHNGHSSFAAAKQSDPAYASTCESVAARYSAAGIALYTADPVRSSLRASICNDQPAGPAIICSWRWRPATARLPGAWSAAASARATRRRARRSAPTACRTAWRRRITERQRYNHMLQPHTPRRDFRSLLGVEYPTREWQSSTEVVVENKL